jgi:2-keto-4-pentenoate hydratase/2-oxohepta-3-ene-1,7-dioic acid hydratase in catechol pathway
MKLIRFGNEGEEKPGLLLEDGRKIDASDFGSDYDENFFGTGGIDRLKAWAEANAATAPAVSDDARIAPPLCRPSKIVCIGLNYSDHAAESGMEVPEEPVIFFKASSAFCGPNDGLMIPRGSEKTDWEVELAFVIGKTASYVDEANAMDHVAGYTLHNDYSERAYQIERCGQWVKGKSCDTFAPVGPFLATPDEIDDPDNLSMWCKVNGETKQNGNTSTMVFKVPFLVHYLSQFMTLLPGDIITTGTPPGVGLGFDPPQFLKAGDVIELGIDGLGTQRQVAMNA